VTTTAAIFIQLVLGTIVVMMLDELVQKGWGIGSGISLFIALGVAQGIFWSLFSPFPISENGVPVPYGAIPYLFHILFTGENLSKAFFRPSIGPTMIGLIMTIIVAAVIIYAEGIRIELPISYARHRGYRGRYPVKLLYVSNIPVILAFALSSTFYMISQLIWARYNADNSNWLLNLLGSYNITSHSPIGGLAYYLTPPGSLNQAMEEPIRSLFFILIMIILTVVFAKIWVEIGGLSAERVSQQLIDAGMQIPGFRRREYSISTVLGRYIPVVTVIGGFFVGLIAGTAQILGVFGSGMGILLTIDILTNYYQLLMKERVEEMYPAISKVLKV
jgi:preprotein translocase subunit SecY